MGDPGADGKSVEETFLLFPSITTLHCIENLHRRGLSCHLRCSVTRHTDTTYIDSSIPTQYRTPNTSRPLRRSMKEEKQYCIIDTDRGRILPTPDLSIDIRKVRHQRGLTDVWRPSNSSFRYADRSVAHPAGVHLLPNTRSNIPKIAAINYTQQRPFWESYCCSAIRTKIRRFVTTLTANSPCCEPADPSSYSLTSFL